MTKQLNIMDYVPDAEEAIDAVTSAMGANKNESLETGHCGLDAALGVSESTGTAMAVLSSRENAITILSTKNGLDPLIESVRQYVKSQLPDYTTEKGRKSAGSLAKDVGKTKMEIKRVAQNLTEDWRTKTKAITTETSRMEKLLDEIRDEVLAPRVEFEQREEARVTARRDRLSQIENLIPVDISFDTVDIASIERAIQSLEELKEFDWQEFKDQANGQVERTNAVLQKIVTGKKKYDADQAELAESRRKLAAQEKKDEEARIAKEAREAALASAIKTIEDAGNIPDNYTSGQISVVIDNVNKTFNTTKWEELGDKADDAYNRVAPILRDRLKAVEKAEADEIERQYQEQEKIKQEAETARVDKLKKYISDIQTATVPDDATSAFIEGKIQLLETSFAKVDWQEFAGEAKAAAESKAIELAGKHKVVKAREDKAEQDRQDKIKKDAEAAAQKKVDDAAAVKKKIDDDAAEKTRIADEKRKNDQAHNAKIIGEVLNDLEAAVQYNPANDDALKSERLKLKMIATAIAAGKVRHVSIKY